MTQVPCFIPGQQIGFLSRQLKHEVLWESGEVPLHGLHQDFSLDAIELI